MSDAFTALNENRPRKLLNTRTDKSCGAEEGTRTPTPLRVHGPEPCASANSATSAAATSPVERSRKNCISIVQAGRALSNRSQENAPVGNVSRPVVLSTTGAPASPHTEGEARHALGCRQGPLAKGFLMGSPPTRQMAPDVIMQLRSLAHDLSNAIETIMQASYLLAQAQLDDTNKKWVSLIDNATQDAARINREIREILRSQT